MPPIKKIKLGKVIHTFKDKPIHLDELLFQKKPEEVYNALQYTGKGKEYTLEQKTKTFKNKPGFYVLELPYTCETDTKKCDKEVLGFKLGKASSNPTGAEASASMSGGLLARLNSYYIEIGKNVKIRHLRVFDTEDLNYYGNRNRANDYETALKAELVKRNVKPARGNQGSEYFKELDPIKRAMTKIQRFPDKDIRDIAPDEFEGKQVGANVETRSKKEMIRIKKRVIVLSKNFSKNKKSLVAARGTITKKTTGPAKGEFTWDIIFDDQLLKKVKKATIHIEFDPKLRNKKVEGGWVLEENESALRIFESAPKLL